MLISNVQNSVLIQGTTTEDLLNAIEQIIDAKLEQKQQQNQTPRLYSIQELANASPVCEGTVRNWIRSGRLKAKKIGRRIFIEEEDFQNALSDVKSLKYQRSI